MTDSGFYPNQIARNVFIASTATVIGNVTLESSASVWYSAVIRGDSDQIVIGAQSNIQDGCVIHADPGYPCLIGQRVTVGHRAIVHGAIIHDDVLIGMGAIVLNGVVIESHCIIGAGAVITENTHIPSGSLVLGIPGKIIKEVSIAQRGMIQSSAENYVEKGQAYRQAQIAATD